MQIVLIHGAVDRAAGMIRVARRIDHCEVVRYDRRGYGRSGHLGQPYTFEEHVHDLELVIGGRPTVLLAIAMEAALHWLPLVAATVMFVRQCHTRLHEPGRAGGRPRLAVTSTHLMQQSISLGE